MTGRRQDGSSGLCWRGSSRRAVLLVVAAANAHLVYVAVATQPDCVAHLKEAGVHGRSYRAAKSRLLRLLPVMHEAGERHMSETDRSYGLLSETSTSRRRATRRGSAPAAQACARLAQGGLARPDGPAGPQPGLWHRGLRDHPVLPGRCSPRAGLHPVPRHRRLHDRRPGAGHRLYGESRALDAGEPHARTMLFVRPRAGAQIFFTGLLLCCCCCSGCGLPS